MTGSQRLPWAVIGFSDCRLTEQCTTAPHVFNRELGMASQFIHASIELYSSKPSTVSQVSDDWICLLQSDQNKTFRQARRKAINFVGKRTTICSSLPSRNQVSYELEQVSDRELSDVLITSVI